MTDSFQAIQPSPLLAPYIKQYWFLKSACAGHVQGIIPTGYVSVFFHRENPLFSVGKNEMCPQAYISGQSVTYSNLLLTGTTDMICIDFLPHTARLFFDVPISEIEETVALYILCETKWTEFGKGLTDIPDNNDCVRLIEQFLIKRISLAKEYNLRRMVAAVNAINSGQADINQLADVVCLSYKQFKRVFSEYVGTNPHTFLRIVRFQKALHTLQIHPQISLTELTYTCGFYDQSHLIREFKSFSGLTPGEYMAVCEPYSDYFS